MDDKEKNVIEQIADKVNDLFENIANTASEAFDQPIEAAPVKPVRQSVPAYEFPVPDSSNQTVSTKKPPAKKRAAKKSAKKSAMSSSANSTSTKPAMKRKPNR
jgi:hypothetical protein